MIYVMSDIHGYLSILKENMKLLELTPRDKLLFLGDYIDRGPESCQTLYYIKTLQEVLDCEVIVLLGNHEQAFLAWLSIDKPEAPFVLDNHLNTRESFIREEDMEAYDAFARKADGKDINHYLRHYIRNNHKELIDWMREMLDYYETEKTIFVHAGINEKAGESWKTDTNRDDFVWKYPPTYGHFYKDIVAGHTSTAQITNDKDFHDVFYDEKSHIFIDGQTEVSDKIPILAYDDMEHIYYSVHRHENVRIKG